jgi:hypothetical protein
MVFEAIIQSIISRLSSITPDLLTITGTVPFGEIDNI